MLGLHLREVTDADVPVFYAQQSDPGARRMVAFASAKTSREEFAEKWAGILANDASTKRTIVVDGEVVGNILAFPHNERTEVGYWIAREHWGKGIATRALAAFLDVVTTRPLYAAAAKDNAGSLRVLEKCGFVVVGEGKGFSDVRGEEVEEFILELRPATLRA
jgi:RimJ/RimL family protein N-acetyltransferase